MSSQAFFPRSASTEWICSWLSTSQPTSGSAFPLALEIPDFLHNKTVRQTLRISLGGRKIRFVFSNRYGTQPLVLGEISFSVSGGSMPVHSVSVTFDGQSGVTIPAGQVISSDEISMSIPSLSILSVRVYLPESTQVTTFHWDARHFSVLESGNQVHKHEAQQGLAISSRLLLESVLVVPEQKSQTLVVIGDSMVDGNGVAMNSYGRWTDLLAERVTAHHVAVVNAGQSGSRLLKDGIGISTLSRFERDVLNQPGVAACIVQVGLNDLGLAGTALDSDSQTPTAEDLIAAYRHLITLARQHHIRLTGVTLVPLRSAEEYGLVAFYQSDKEAIRQQVNHWMRTSGEFDAVIDSDNWVRSPDCHHQLNPQYDSGDHLHLNVAGHQRISEAISLNDILALSPESPLIT